MNLEGPKMGFTIGQSGSDELRQTPAHSIGRVARPRKRPSPGLRDDWPFGASDKLGDGKHRG
jgi:hypothetical protein